MEIKNANYNQDANPYRFQKPVRIFAINKREMVKNLWLPIFLLTDRKVWVNGNHQNLSNSGFQIRNSSKEKPKLGNKMKLLEVPF